MSKLLIATNNAGKVREIKAILGGLFDEVVSLKEAGYTLEVEEDGDTFEQNAVKKARAAAALTGLPALADDSGLCVDALSGAPGVWSARYASENATDADNNAKLLGAMEGVAARGARFVSVVALATGDTVMTARGEVRGEILRAPRGGSGFGYDPLFYSPELGQTFGEAPAEDKNRISHRARALAALREKLEQ